MEAKWLMYAASSTEFLRGAPGLKCVGESGTDGGLNADEVLVRDELADLVEKRVLRWRR